MTPLQITSVNRAEFVAKHWIYQGEISPQGDGGLEHDSTHDVHTCSYYSCWLNVELSKLGVILAQHMILSCEHSLNLQQSVNTIRRRSRS